jgi:hypothetical protein
MRLNPAMEEEVEVGRGDRGCIDGGEKGGNM